MKRAWFIRFENIAAILMVLMQALSNAQEKRSRHAGLQFSQSSSTPGSGNIHLSLFGRTFLWDNQAAQKFPPLLPHGEISYGYKDFGEVNLGLNAVSYVFQPGYAYLRLKATPMNNKLIRFLGVAGSLEMKRQLFNFFPSNGYRVKTEGFGPEGFIFGNSNPITSIRTMTAIDLEMIQISSYLPFKLYFNFGWEGAFSSFIEDDNASRAKITGRKSFDQSFAKIPLSLGLELKTFSTDFFAEVETDPFISNLVALTKNRYGWSRYSVVGKQFDVSLWETPIYANFGTRMKYFNGLELQGGFSWLLSRDFGPSLGPCHSLFNICREGANDGFSPFYPQWKVFGLVRYPLKFIQPSSELYRSFLLHRFTNRSKRVDIKKSLGAKDTVNLDEQDRKQKLEERRREADAKAIDLN